MDDVHAQTPFNELRSSKLYRVLNNPTDARATVPKVDQVFKVVSITPDRRSVTIMGVPRGNGELMMQIDANTYPDRSFVQVEPSAAAAAGGRRRRTRSRRRSRSRRRY